MYNKSTSFRYKTTYKVLYPDLVHILYRYLFSVYFVSLFYKIIILDFRSGLSREFN